MADQKTDAKEGTVITPNQQVQVVPPPELTIDKNAGPANGMPDADFFAHLLMLAQPQPGIAPGHESYAHLAVYEADVDPNLTFKADARTQLAINTAMAVESTLRFIRVLGSFNRVHLFFSLPYGRVSWFEHKLREEDPILTEFKRSFLILQGEIKQLKIVIDRRISDLEQKQAAAQEVALANAKRAREQLAAERARHMVNINRAAWRVDPVMPGISLPTGHLSSIYFRHFSALYWHMVAWGSYQTLQEQKAWSAVAFRLAERLENAVRAAVMFKTVLTADEVEQFCLWLYSCVTDPGMWILGVNDELSALELRGR